jgi:cell pole-organizing protein PopZ
MLREWLDKHLPQMVQRLVQREIDRIIHRSDPA